VQLTHRHRKTLAYFLLALFSLPGVGFSATVHYCNGHLSGLSLIGQADGCHDQIDESCHSSQTKKSCCAGSDHDSKDCCVDTDSFNVLDYDGMAQVSDVIADYGIYADVLSAQPDLFINYNIHHYDPVYPQPPPLSGFEKRIAYGSFLC